MEATRQAHYGQLSLCAGKASQAVSHVSLPPLAGLEDGAGGAHSSLLSAERGETAARVSFRFLLIFMLLAFLG